MACYTELVADFVKQKDADALAHKIEGGSDGFSTNAKQWDVWKKEIDLLQPVLKKVGWSDARIVFEYTIPRIHLRLDVVLLMRGQIFILEFKGHEKTACRGMRHVKKNREQVWRYAKYICNCHGLSARCSIFPILVTFDAPESTTCIGKFENDDSICGVSCVNQ